MTSNCDVTNSAHQIQMTTYDAEPTPLMKIFCVRHWLRHCTLGSLFWLVVSFANKTTTIIENIILFDVSAYA